jgi:hypothetical protein
MQTGSGDLSSIRAYEDRERQAKDDVTVQRSGSQMPCGTRTRKLRLLGPAVTAMDPSHCKYSDRLNPGAPFGQCRYQCFCT